MAQCGWPRSTDPYRRFPIAAHPYNIIETNDEGGNEPTAAAADALGLTREAMRVRIAGGVGQLAGELRKSPAVGTLLLTGGDTLFAVYEQRWHPRVGTHL